MDTILCLPAILVTVCFPQDMFPSSHQLRKSQGNIFPLVEMLWKSHRLAVNQLGGLYCHTALLKVCYPCPSSASLQMGPCYVLGFVFFILCEVSIYMYVQTKNSNRTTVATFQFLIFCMVVAFSSPFFSLLCH